MKISLLRSATHSILFLKYLFSGLYFVLEVSSHCCLDDYKLNPTSHSLVRKGALLLSALRLFHVSRVCAGFALALLTTTISCARYRKAILGIVILVDTALLDP